MAQVTRHAGESSKALGEEQGFVCFWNRHRLPSTFLVTAANH